jgi:hypothetical protein
MIVTRPGPATPAAASLKKTPRFLPAWTEHASLRSTRTAVPSSRVSAGVLQAYFGANFQAETPNPFELLARQAVAWFHQSIEPIPPLERDNRKNHRVHLRMMGDVLGLLPVASSAQEAYRQYVAIFKALEAKAAPGKKDYRMVCHGALPMMGHPPYGIRQDGFYVLVFAPNGAVESFRRNTPAEIEIDGITATHYPLRSALFEATRKDYEQLRMWMEQLQEPPSAPPAELADPQAYTRRIFKAGSDGKDAWNQPCVSPFQENRSRFEAWRSQSQAVYFS